MCCLRPGVQGISENIRVVSLVGRYLEHSRIYYFHNQGKEEVYIGSADWMTRNLDRRVEAIVPVEDPEIVKDLEEILAVMLADNRQAWIYNLTVNTSNDIQLTTRRAVCAENLNGNGSSRS
jgi:polyphosphate kinase